MKKIQAYQESTIVALATGSGGGAIAVIRISGAEAISVVNSFFKGNSLAKAKGYSLHLGQIMQKGKLLDQVLVSVFRKPKSYTGEDMVEISCHNSAFIVESIIGLCLSRGIEYAKAGEFTQRAFLNGKMNLMQAESIADLIAAENASSHELAISQLRGGISKELQEFKSALMDFAALIELELDFSEEDVSFAQRTELQKLLENYLVSLNKLLDSFEWGNAVKQGIPIAIIGKPNAGKSTLLNALVNEERAIVSPIAGTTRDTIEDQITIERITFRLIDTAGLRESKDAIESIGIAKAYQTIEKAHLILYVFDAVAETEASLTEAIIDLKKYKKMYLLVANKADLREVHFESKYHAFTTVSAKRKTGLSTLKSQMVSSVSKHAVSQPQQVLTNIRHYKGLQNVKSALEAILKGLEKGIYTDLLAVEMRSALHHIGELTGEITQDDILANIFGKFCIGK